MDDAQLARYSRHILLDEWGVEAHVALASSRVLIVGLGGLGCPAAHQLAAAGVGHLTLADGDVVDATNLQRQYLHTADTIGIPKVRSARLALQAINPLCRVAVIDQNLAEEALLNAVFAHDLVLDCSDNFATRHAINQACVAHRKPLFSAAAIRFDGQFIVFDSRQEGSPCYACVFPQAGQESEFDRCGVAGVFAPLTVQMGAMQAGAALRWIVGAGRVNVGELLMVNALDGAQQCIRVPRNSECLVCAPR